MNFCSKLHLILGVALLALKDPARDMTDVVSIFDRYQAVRPRLPQARFERAPTRIDSLLDIADTVDAFVFDAFGVLNVGETPIPGAARRLDQLRDTGRAIRILSNAASYDHDRAAENGTTYDIEKVKLVAEKQPSLEFATPEQIGALALFLCSEPAAQITGQAISVDGGWTAQ